MNTVLDFLLQGLALGFSAGISPGPLLALFMGKAIQDGWRKTLPAAFAPLISDGPIILLMLFLLSQIPDFFLDLLRIGGGGFLIYLGWKTLQDRDAASKNQDSPTTQHTLRSAALINLLNPNPYIFWGTVLGPVFILGWRQAPAAGLSFIVGFYTTMIGIFMLWIIITGSLGSLKPRVRRTITILSGIGLIGFGIFQIASGLGILTGS